MTVIDQDQALTGHISALPTPSLLLDRGRLERNIAAMAARAHALAVPLRPHGKTPKNGEIGRLLIAAGAIGLTVSTLAEAEAYFAAGIADLFYAVPLAPQKVARVAALLSRGAAMTCLIDHSDAAWAVGSAAQAIGATVPVIVEVDVDGYRTGIAATADGVVALAQLIVATPGLRFVGIMSYGGASYGATMQQATALAEVHRQALVNQRATLEAAGIECHVVSFGSSPAVLHARTMQGVTELRCGIYVFQDLFQAAIGACTIDDIAVSVLATVIGVQHDRNRIVVDAGGLAMSKDLSTARTSHDAGYGLVCDEGGQLIEGVYMPVTSQELGLITTFDGSPLPFDTLPIGSRVRILPNHSDMTAAAYAGYHVIGSDGSIVDWWERANGW